MSRVLNVKKVLSRKQEEENVKPIKIKVVCLYADVCDNLFPKTLDMVCATKTSCLKQSFHPPSNLKLIEDHKHLMPFHIISTWKSFF